MRLYSELARWWPLFSPPSHYTEEAEALLPVLRSAPDRSPQTVLELGAGAGSLAWHFKRYFALTLTDLSEPMLAQSRAVNPECAHIQGDMRTLRLDRQFDLVLIHDAIMYLTEPASVQAALLTARLHCRAGGGLVVVPDCVKETLASSTTTGGEDGTDGRGLRYLEWHWDPDPADHTFESAWAFLLRHADGTIETDHDYHTVGVFARAQWLAWLEEAGFNAISEIDRWNRDVFSGRKA